MRLGAARDQRLAVAGVLDRRIALDQVPERRVVGAVEAQEVDAGFGGDALARAVGADQRAAFEQRQFVGGADVQHVQAGVVAAREGQRQQRRLHAGLARADVGMALGRDVVAVLRLVARQVRRRSSACLRSA